MLAKIINLKKNWDSVADAANYVASDEKDVLKTIKDPLQYEPDDAAHYIARDGVMEGGSFNMEGLNPVNFDDRGQIIKIMDATARAWSQKTKAKKDTNPFYHCVLSWKDGERPTLEQASDAAEKALKSVGLEKNQAFFAIHRDKEHHHHIHIIANRVHPDHLVLTGPPRFDYLILDKTCREIELEQGWKHDNGPHVVIDGEIKRLTHSQRKQLGLIKDKSTEPGAPSVKSRMAEVASGMPPLASWLKNKVGPELMATKNWDEFHRACADRGLSVIKVKSGLIFETQILDKTTQTKASAVHYSLSLGRLTQRFGEFSPAKEGGRLVNQEGRIYGRTYNDYVARYVCGLDPDANENPGRTGQTEKRTKAALARAEARKALFEQFKEEKYNAKDRRKAARDEMREVHIDEKKDLIKHLSSVKKETVANLRVQFGDQVGKSLWAAKKTAAMEALAEKQRCERLALTHAHSMEWLPWLERQAAAGNEAAISALRGLRYRAQRERNRVKAGFEGEDLGEVRPEQSNQNGITGTEREAFNIRNAQLRITEQHNVEYLDDQGKVRLTDQGPRIEMAEENDEDAMRAGLLLASEKYGGEVFITGTDVFRARAAKEAMSLGIKVKNLDHNLVDRQKNKESPGKDVER